jgi:hypothetical protein
MSQVEEDAEVKAMTSAFMALKPLQPEEQERVMAWLQGKLGLKCTFRTPARKTVNSNDENAGAVDDDNQNGDPASSYTDFADLCAAASPNTDAEKALVAGYWFQVCSNQSSFGSQECNTALKHFGTPVGNVTRAFDALIGGTPKLVVQMQKAGTTKQARKLYKLTHHGIQKVKSMLNG